MALAESAVPTASSRPLLEVRGLLAQGLESLLRRLVLLLLERRLLDLELHHLAGDLVELGGHRVDLGADHGAGLVDQVDRLRAGGYDLKKVCAVGVNAFFRQVFIHGLFHADLHGGNILILPENKVALVDCFGNLYQFFNY